MCVYVYVYIYIYRGEQHVKQSDANQPYQGHQPWQSNSRPQRATTGVLRIPDCLIADGPGNIDSLEIPYLVV